MRKQALLRRTGPVTSTTGPREWRMGIVKDLLTDLQTATVGGRRFTTEKIVKLLAEETAAASPELPGGRRRALAAALGDLRTEQERPSPRVDAFLIRAEVMLSTLAQS